MNELINTYIHYLIARIFHLCVVTKETCQKTIVGKKRNSDDLMVLTYLALLAHNSSEGFKKTQLLMYRTFGLLREHGRTDKLFILLVFLSWVSLLTELEGKFSE